MNARCAFRLVVYYYDKLNLRFCIKRARYQSTTKELVSIRIDIACRYLFSFALNFFRLAAVDLASHAVVFRGVVLPSSPQTPAYPSSTFLSAA